MSTMLARHGPRNTTIHGIPRHASPHGPLLAEVKGSLGIRASLQTYPKHQLRRGATDKSSRKHEYHETCSGVRYLQDKTIVQSLPFSPLHCPPCAKLQNRYPAEPANSSRKKRQMVDPNVGKENINVLSVLPAKMKKKKKIPRPPASLV